MSHVNFKEIIIGIIKEQFGESFGYIFENSLLIQYIVEKTKSANRGSKSRGSFANLYAIYVIVEDYLDKHFDTDGGYSNYEGARFSDLFTRQRELPFGARLQNHALNNRMNAEFSKFFPICEYQPIIRNLETNRYWFNENLLIIKNGGKTYNIAKTIILIINEYIKVKQSSFQRFFSQCQGLQELEGQEESKIIDFIKALLAPNVDARLFEIVSYSVLKYYYNGQKIIWGYDWDNLNEEELSLYKTGRTNANDGGIDFVMKPLGRFFQVTETVDFKKYFLDIEKIEKYPITFVVKTDSSVDELIAKLKEDALRTYVISSIVEKYMDCIEEIINIPTLVSYFEIIVKSGLTKNVLDEIILQSKVEFNYEEDNEEGNE